MLSRTGSPSTMPPCSLRGHHVSAYLYAGERALAHFLSAIGAYVRDLHTAFLLSASLSDERVDILLRVKGLQIVDALAEADELHRHAKLLRDGDADAALGRAVELR